MDGDPRGRADLHVLPVPAPTPTPAPAPARAAQPPEAMAVQHMLAEARARALAAARERMYLVAARRSVRFEMHGIGRTCLYVGGGLFVGGFIIGWLRS